MRFIREVALNIWDGFWRTIRFFRDLPWLVKVVTVDGGVALAVGAAYELTPLVAIGAIFLIPIAVYLASEAS